MDARLIVIGGNVSKRNLALRLPTVIGRSTEAKVTIKHPMISRRHCEVFELGGLLMVRDLGSLNGTCIDGRRIKQAPLPPNAEFSIGPLSFRAEYEYQGDLGKLPPTVFAESAADAPASDSKPKSDAVEDSALLTKTVVEGTAEVSDEDMFLEQLGILPELEPKAVGKAPDKVKTTSQEKAAGSAKAAEKSQPAGVAQPAAKVPVAGRPIEKSKPAGNAKPAETSKPAQKAANGAAKTKPQVAAKAANEAVPEPVKNPKADPFDDLLDNL
jgi:pSer/pThr/pTyr-binding forkhead associated (FHA) protein